MALSNSSESHHDLSQTLVDAFLDLTQEERKQREKLSAKRRLKARRAIEDYFERKRLARELGEDWLTE